MSTQVFLGRQAILDRSRRTCAYALLYRNGENNESFFSDPGHATGWVLELTMLQWGFDRVVGDRLGLINVSTRFLTADLLSMLPAGRAVVILDDANFGEHTMQAIRKSSARGLRFALDDVRSVDRSRAGMQ